MPRTPKLPDWNTDAVLVVVGSNNPVKLNATKQALSRWKRVTIVAHEVASGVPAQPMTDAQTRRGARTRARNAWLQATALSRTQPLDPSQKATHPIATHCLGIGLEGGVFQRGHRLWSTVWVSVCADGHKVFESNGARFALPASIAQPILAGSEMGDVLADLFAGADIKRQQGGIGVLTRDFVTRTQEYAAIASLALGLWYGQGWQKGIEDSSRK